MSSSMAACVDETITNSDNEGFTPTSDSTWGDVYRYFDLEGFEALPADVQAQYDNLPFEEETKLDTKGTEANDDMIYVSTTGYLYAMDEEESNLNTRGTDIKGLLNLSLEVSSTTTSIEHTTALFSTVTYPSMYVTTMLYDKENGNILAAQSETAKNSNVCSIDDSFTGLKSKHEYMVKACGIVQPPEGYYSSGNLYTQIDKKTK